MKAGSICTGMGGLEQGLKMVFPDVELAWVADNDKAASILLAERYPGVPNLGDIKKVDWSTVPRVDILTAGIPCQPFSDAGLRNGHDDDRDLTGSFLQAIRVLRPSVVILENVSGFRKRGLSRVLRGLASMGFHVRWHSVRASEAGAPHRRERVFVLAFDPNGKPWEQWGITASGQEESGRPWADLGGSNRVGGWGKYEPAIRRWESVFGCVAPPPTIPGRGGIGRTSSVFLEWMMGLPKGHVTDAGLPNNSVFKLIGNGVVPRQAALAIRGLMYE